MITRRFLIFVFIVAIALLLTGCWREAPKRVPATVASESAKAVPAAQGSSLLGLWKAEKIYSMSPQTNAWQEGDLSAYPDGLYTEFTDKAMCGAWQNEESRCLRYDSYTISGNTVTVQQEGVTGPPWNYKWGIKDGKLELIGIINGQPFIRTIYTKVR